jgi:GH15 family glucan-1,4-alpha-glucosidase
MLCTFWLAEALAVVGDRDAARAVLDRVRSVRAPLGLLAEHVLPASSTMTGNFPQAYSHVGAIHAAFAIAPPWSDVI